MEELYDAYCIQRRLRDGASKMVAAFNSATGSREARESLSEANKGYKECTEVSDGVRAEGDEPPSNTRLMEAREGWMLLELTFSMGGNHLERLVCSKIILDCAFPSVCSTCAHWRVNLKVKWENFMSR